jgi:pre-mRNA-processing factor 19
MWWQIHSKAVSGISLHPTGEYVLSASDKSWGFSDIRTTKTLYSAEAAGALSCIQWHPDGVIFGAGTADKCALFSCCRCYRFFVC